ncbi:MAG: LmbE family protein, partial [Bryobacterales bacterium]|nr:LmbE family protein [Bryobacterales bacterium]
MRIICIGAHPDDCELKFGGTAAKLAIARQHEKFGPPLVEIRRRETEQAAQRLGIAEAQVLNAPDGALQPDGETRGEIIRQIRNCQAEVVLSHRGCD